jgi:RND family efflux transporter MFP subunit
VALAAATEARADLDEGATATELAAAQAEVDQKKLALSDAEAALAATRLTAPFDGTILEVHVTVGDTVASGKTILTLANLQELQVVASVDETTVRSVSAGQKAQVTFDALPGVIVTGAVGEIPLQGTLQGDVMIYEVPVSLEGAQNLGARVGMTADVAIATGEAANALLVPTMALFKSNGMHQVLVADPAQPDADAQAAPVQTGLSNGTYTQITAGLNEGDQVVVEMSGSTENSQNRSLQRGAPMGMFGIR